MAVIGIPTTFEATAKLVESVRNRTMPKESYKSFQHSIRRLRWKTKKCQLFASLLKDLNNGKLDRRV